MNEAGHAEGDRSLARQNFGIHFVFVAMIHVAILGAIYWWMTLKPDPVKPISTPAAESVGGINLRDVTWTESLSVTEAESPAGPMVADTSKPGPESEIALPKTTEVPKPEPEEAKEVVAKLTPAPDPVPEPQPVPTPKLEPVPESIPDDPPPAPGSAPKIAANLTPVPDMAPSDLEPAPESIPRPIPQPQPRLEPLPMPVPEPAVPDLDPVPPASDPVPQPQPARPEPAPEPRPEPQPPSEPVRARPMEPAPEPAPSQPSQSEERVGRWTPPSSPASAADIGDYHRHVYRAFTDHWQRPAAAITLGRDYEVRAQVKIARNGRIVSAKIIKPSGHPEIDESIRNAIQKVRSIQPLPEGVGGDTYSVILLFKID